VNLDDVTNGLEGGFRTTLASGPVTAGAPVVIQVPKLEAADRERLAAEAYAAAAESPFLRPTDAPLSTFSIDVDTASYANVRRLITAGMRPPPDAVRLEELVNYSTPTPASTDDPLPSTSRRPRARGTSSTGPSAWLSGREIARKERPASNLVSLVDVSGSMDAGEAPSSRRACDARRRANERDSVAIVTYAGASGRPAAHHLREEGRSAGPSTACRRRYERRRGHRAAYQLAAERFVAGGVNRVILATDGDFNVGVTSQDDLLKLIEAKAKSRIFLTTLGYGMGNLKDSTLEMLADKGNGTYGYVDTTREPQAPRRGGRRHPGDDREGRKGPGGVQPEDAGAYRLVGYDNRCSR
jgi:Ca-activated chloride channel family protein